MFFRNPMNGNEDGQQSDEFDPKSGKTIMIFGLVAVAIIVAINLISRWL
jgi:hypothetical protein